MIKRAEISLILISTFDPLLESFEKDYEFSFSKDKNEDDILFKEHGINYLIDETSINFLSGSKLEYIDELGGAFFSINNPNATANCGCGTSFSI